MNQMLSKSNGLSFRIMPQKESGKQTGYRFS